MDRIPHKTNPKLFDKEVLKIQNALADNLNWLDYAFGICETLTSVKEGKKFISANLYVGNERYEQIMPCEELGNFAFFVLRDPQELGPKDKNLIKCPFSLIIWYDTRKVSLPTDERNREAIKEQILGVLDNLHSPNFSIARIYENPKNIFAEYTYDFVNNQYLMSPFAGLRIDGVMETRVSCLPNRLDFNGSYNGGYQLSFDR